MSLRVLHVVAGLNVGGAETWLVQGLPAIDRTRYCFDFLVYGNGPQHYRARIEAAGATVLTCPPPRRVVAFVTGLLRVLHTYKYDAIHLHTYCSSGIVLLLAKWAGISIRVFHSHTGQDESNVGVWRSLYFRLSRWLIRHFATEGIAVSEEAAQPFFPRGWRHEPERWRVSPIGIDLSLFEGEGDRENVRRELGIPEGATAVVHVGRFVGLKNHDLLVEIARGSGSSPNWIFVLVGDGELREGIEQRTQKLGLSKKFRFTGNRSDVPRLLRACDVFVLPSLCEGFPMAYLEAQAAGLPCVISNAITRSADLVPERTTRKSPADPAVEWAQALLGAASIARLEQMPRELENVSVQRSMQRLVECYRRG